MPRPGGAASSYLVRSHDAAVLLDVGGGSFSKLQLAIDYTRLDAIVVSHMHADHFFDLVPFRYALKYGHLSTDRRLPLWLPPGGRASLEALRRAVSIDAPDDFFDAFFEVREYDPVEQLHVKGLHLRFARTRHYIEAYAIRVARESSALAYSGDTAPSDAVIELACACSIFLCEAGLGLGSEEGERGHSSAEEAGEMAAAAGAQRVVLTHYPSAYEPRALVDAACRRFRGPVEAADDGMEVAV